jgi:hypothetical protein
MDERVGPTLPTQERHVDFSMTPFYDLEMMLLDMAGPRQMRLREKFVNTA